MKQSRTWFVLALTSLLVVDAGCSRGNKVHLTQVDQTLSVDPGVTRLIIKNRVGTVHIAAGPADRIAVQADVFIEPDRAGDTPKGTFEDWVQATGSGDTLTIADAGLGRPADDYWNVTLSLQVPSGLNVQVDTHVGRITIEDLESELTLNSDVGDIVARSTSFRAIHAHSGTGSLRIEAANLTESVALDADVGRIAVTTRSIGGSFEAQTGTGSVEFIVSESPPNGDTRITTGVGHVHVRIPNTAAGTFRLSTGVGNLEVKRPTQTRRTSFSTAPGPMEFTVGENGPQYDIRTGTGDILLD